MSISVRKTNAGVHIIRKYGAGGAKTHRQTITVDEAMELHEGLHIVFSGAEEGADAEDLAEADETLGEEGSSR